MSAAPEDLERLRARDKEPLEDENDMFEDVDDSTEALVSTLKEAHDMLRLNSVLFEYLAEPLFVARMSKRERKVIDKHLIGLYKTIDIVNKTVEASDEFEEE